MKKNYKETKPIKGLKREVRELHKDEMQQILWQTEQPIINRLSDEVLDRRNEMFQLRSGVETSYNQLIEVQKRYKKYLLAKIREHQPTFPVEIYDQWRRLRGWDKQPYAKHHKPPVFAHYTKQFIYGRFPKEILPELEKRNDYYPGTNIRLNRHFQYLTKRAYTSLTGYIQDVIGIAKTCKTMYEFRYKYAGTFGKPFQLSLFEDNNITL